MAILGDFEVTVNIGGVPATEYDGDQHDGEGDQQSATSVTKYIEAVSGQFFGFVLTVKRGYVMPIGDTIAWRIKIDGKFVTGINFQRDLLARNGGFVDHLDGIDRRINGQNILQKFKFSDLSLRRCFKHFKPIQTLMSLTKTISRRYGRKRQQSRVQAEVWRSWHPLCRSLARRLR